MCTTHSGDDAVAEMTRYNIDILGISEARWTDANKTTIDGVTILHSGRKDGVHMGGVALFISKMAAKTLTQWEPISERIITARFVTQHAKVTVVQCYAPTEAADDADKENFYNTLQDVLNNIPQHDIKLLIGDLNAKVGQENTGWERTMGRNGTGVQNSNGEKFVEFCQLNNLVIGGTKFLHRLAHKVTWRSPDGKYLNQIDHIAISGRWSRSMMDVRSYRGADMASDHFLVMARLKIRLKACKKRSDTVKYDIGKLKEADIKEKFAVSTANRFQALADIDADIEEKWEHYKKAVHEAGREVLGRAKRKKEEWISTDIWKLIEERKILQIATASKQSDNELHDKLKNYQAKDKQVKKSARKDKRTWLNTQVQRAETASKTGDMRTVFRIVKNLAGEQGQKCLPVQAKDGTIITEETQKLDRWREHFQETLNRPTPATPLSEEDLVQSDIPTIGPVDTSPFTMEEITKAIKGLKTGKAPGIDNIGLCAELLKAGSHEMTQWLLNICNTAWDTETAPSEWKRGIIIKLPKKGTLYDCNNWRGIVLLAIPEKVYNRMILWRLKTQVETVLREEQAGFRAGRSCVDQIFTLRRILEQVLEHRIPLLITFVDFEKAFDSIDREGLWKIMATYGIPSKYIRVIANQYWDSECCVKVEDRYSEWFRVITGVKQGCVLSPLLFGLAMDWLMRQTKTDRGIDWVNGKQLEDLDFADDIALLEHGALPMGTRLENLERTGEKIGLKISYSKTKVLEMYTTGGGLKVNGKDIQSVSQFTYLGSLVTDDNRTDVEMKTRFGKAAGAVNKLSKIWNNKSFSIQVKLRLYNSTTVPIVLWS